MGSDADASANRNALFASTFTAISAQGSVVAGHKQEVLFALFYMFVSAFICLESHTPL